MNFLTLAQAKRHLHIHPTNSDHDVDVLEKSEEATAIIANYLEVYLATVPADWEVANTSPVVYNVPQDVKSATKLVLSELFNNREAPTSTPLSPQVKDLLRRRRAPAIA